MAIKAQSLAAHWFTPRSQEGEQSPAQFRVRPLSALEWYELADNMGQLKGSAITVIENGLLGWKNVENPETGEALDFNATNIWTLPTAVLDEIGEHIVKITKTDEADEKN